MKIKFLLPVFLLIIHTYEIFNQTTNSCGTFPPFTMWYQNPLGISPVALHTVNGIIIPSLAAGLILIFRDRVSTILNDYSIYNDAGYTKGYYGSYSNLYHNNFGVNFILRKYLSFVIEFTQVYVIDNVNNTFGLGVRPLFRFYALNNDKFKVYFISGAGLIYFFDNFPKPSGFFSDLREGTKFNGCPKYGIGLEYKVFSKFYLTAGLWHIHISNGNNPGYERNQGHDSNGLSFGVVYNINSTYKKSNQRL